ncbi:MAG TPA: N-acetyltransferase [Terracidiphilus sp.]|nr:N-acetyltransferase [Terracidiphilus sp.]
MLYRPYTSQDFDALYAIEKLCFEPIYRFSRGLMRRLVRRPNAVTWIAEENGQLAGFAIAEFSSHGCKSGVPSDGALSMGRKSQVTAYIQTIEVLPTARGKGVGGEILVRVEGSARLAGAALVWLHVEAGNAAAIRLYAAQDYFCEGRQENYYPLGRAALIYVKRLTPETS